MTAVAARVLSLAIERQCAAELRWLKATPAAATTIAMLTAATTAR